MQRLRPFFALVFCFLLVLGPVNATTFWAKPDTPERIISLSPNITETLFALGVGDHVVAVTDYCDYPKAVERLERIGGFVNPNLERIISLRPDLVILLRSQHTIIEQLTQLGIETLSVDNRRLSDIQSSIEHIGLAVGQPMVASRLLSSLSAQIQYVRNTVSTQPKPRVLISLAHALSEDIGSVYIAGQQDFYHDLLLIAGGNNAYDLPYPKVPYLSMEGLLTLDPDLIIDILPEADDHDSSATAIKQQWQKLVALTAVQQDRVHILESSYATIPGPRVGLLLLDIARLIHPELTWENQPYATP